MSGRNIYLDNKPLDEALDCYLKCVEAIIEVKTESIEVIDALDRITAEPVFAKVNSPLYDSAAMDGIAVISSHTNGAGEATPLTLRQGEDYLPVDTGDPVKPPYNAVIMIEDIQTSSTKNYAVIRAAAAPWQHVRPVGEDIVQGEMILPSRHKIRPIDIGVLLSGGVTHIKVRRQPMVAIIPTGTELIEPGETAKEGDIIESNSRMLEALVVKSGGKVIRFAPISDDYDTVKKALDNASAYDMVMIIAGTSAGREDYTPQVIKELGEIIVHGVAIKPGKPIILAVVNKKPIIGIPGYPVSAYLTYENFASKVMAAYTGIANEDSKTIKATLTRRLVSSLKHKEYVRVKVGRIGDKLVASPLARGAGAAMSLVRADGFCVIEQDSEGIEAGTQVDIVLSRRIDFLEKTLVCIGSHDLILDLMADTMSSSKGIFLSSTHVGSMAGLQALKNGEAHITSIHLLDEATGAYNIEFIKKIFQDNSKQVAVIKGVGRIQGIMVKKGNPLGINDITDLIKCCYINRQRGAGTRILLDYLLKKANIDVSQITGYDREATTHMAVAAAIKNGSADAGFGVYSAAKAMELDFVPISKEEYDFAVPVEFLNSSLINVFIQILKSPDFHFKLDELGGYTYENIGSIKFLK